MYLYANTIKIKDHEWEKTATWISNLGFFCKIDAGNYTREEFEHDLTAKLAACSGKHLPKYKCKFSSLFNYDEVNNVQISTKAYNLEVKQKYA